MSEVHLIRPDWNRLFETAVGQEGLLDTEGEHITKVTHSKANVLRGEVWLLQGRHAG